MIREIINFTKNLIEDTPDVLEWNAYPSNGIHMFVDIDNTGEWTNRSFGADDLFITSADNYNPILLQYERMGYRVGTTMNKVLDPRKQIFSCSPYIISFKKKTLTNDKIEGFGLSKIINILPAYFNNAQQCIKNDELCVGLSKSFMIQSELVLKQMECHIVNQYNPNFDGKKLFDCIGDDDYINLYLRTIPLEMYKRAHDAYLYDKLFNNNSFNSFKDNTLYGLSNFLNGLNSKKPFLEHKTSLSKINGKISTDDACVLNNFEILINNRVLPNPLPLVIDNRELQNKIIKICNTSEERIPLRQILMRLYEDDRKSDLANYYLLFFSKRKSLIVNDLDFVPLFHFHTEITIIDSITNANDSKKIKNVFELEECINHFFMKYHKDTRKGYGFMIGEYFSSPSDFKDLKNKLSGKGYEIRDNTWNLFLKYRKSIYDYVYKSKDKALSTSMIDEIAYNSILDDISKDEFQERRHTKRFEIINKLNIWFGLFDFFNNNKFTNMISSIKELQQKMADVVTSEDVFLESSQEFAFAAGQIVSYLMDRSNSSDKTYAMLEPYLQKGKVSLLQDAIANNIAIYKHDISVAYVRFKKMSAQVLTYGPDVDMKPLLKYFLAGCFSNSVLYN